MNCSCDQEAKFLETKKPGPNQGRHFYACAKPQGSQCDFFCWEGETPRGVSKRVSASNLQSTALAQIQAQLARIETRLDKMAEFLKNQNSSYVETRPATKEELKNVPF